MIAKNVRPGDPLVSLIEKILRGHRTVEESELDLIHMPHLEVTHSSCSAHDYKDPYNLVYRVTCISDTKGDALYYIPRPSSVKLIESFIQCIQQNRHYLVKTIEEELAHIAESYYKLKYLPKPLCMNAFSITVNFNWDNSVKITPFISGEDPITIYAKDYR